MWWRQKATEKQLRATLVDSRDAKGRRRIGGEMNTQKGLETEGRRRTGWVVGMMGRRQETTRWANDLVWQVEMMGRRWGMPSLVDEPVW